MALMTKAEILEQVETATTAILQGAQSYQIGDRVWKAAELQVLVNYAKDLRSEIASEAAVAAGTKRTVAHL